LNRSLPFAGGRQPYDVEQNKKLLVSEAAVANEPIF
jgi:hypothetical protein